MPGNSTCNAEQSVCDEIESLTERGHIIYIHTLKFSILTDVIILAASVIVLALVICKYKGKDCFLYMTPLFFLLYGILYIPYDWMRLRSNREHEELMHNLEITGFFF